MKTVNPTPGDFEAAVANVPADTPVVMLNLLKFKEWADYGDDNAEITGREAYNLYISEASKNVAEYGAKIIWSGAAKACIIAPTEEDWDSVLLVRYPSIQAFTEMSAKPGLAELMVHRTAGLEDSRLIATIEGEY